MIRRLFSRLGGHQVIDLAEYVDARYERGNGHRRVEFHSRLFADYHPHDKQRQLHRTDARFVAVCAGRRSGKTYAGGRDFLRRIFRDLAKFKAAGGVWEHPGKIGPEVIPALEYWAVAPTYPLGTYQRREIFDILGGASSPLVLDYNRSHNDLWLAGGVKICFRSADRPNFLVGSGLNGLWLDEAARIKENAWTDNLRATLSDKQGWALFTTTPLGKNWFWRLIWQKTQLSTDPRERDRQYFGIHFTTADNTRLPHLVAEANRARLELPAAIYRRNYAADFDAFEGKVFESFLDNDTHVVDSIPWHRIVRKIAGVDWGHGNPGVQLEIGIDADGAFWVMREDYQAGLTVRPPTFNPSGPCWLTRFKAAARRGCEQWWADPAGRDNIAECREEGLNFTAATNDVAAGIDALNAMLTPAAPVGVDGRATPGLFIHRSCVNLRRELSSYRYDNNGERPVKTDDHTVDALRYAIYSEHKKGGGIARLSWSMFDGPPVDEVA